MDELDMQETPDADDIIIELLTELVQQGRDRRAGAVMDPPPEAPAVAEPQDAEMAELEQMLAAPPEEAPPEAPLEENKKKLEDEDETE